MKDKEKQIEEICKMAVMGCRRNPQAHTVEECVNCDFKNGMCDVYRVAEKLYEQGYRKIDKDSVVLSRDNYNRLKRDSELYEARHEEKLKLFAKAYNQGGKETAEKIFTEVLDLEQLKVIRDMGWENVYNTLYNEILELAKQFGVEIKE